MDQFRFRRAGAAERHEPIDVPPPDPPLLDRIAWREGIKPETLISGDRGLIARTFGSLFVAGALAGYLMLLIGERTDRHDGILVALCTLALLGGVTAFVGYRRLPLAFFHALLVFGTLLITGAALSASHGAEGVYGFFYVWVAVIAFLFFAPRVAALHFLLAAVGFGTVLFARDSDFAINHLIAAVVCFSTTGVIMGLLRSGMERIAKGLDIEANTDPLTALANRRLFDERFASEVARALRYNRPLSLVICDLDHFKSVNDSLGHEGGDLALRQVAATIARSVRSIDTVARIGGEEFALILPDADREEAISTAERIRERIQSSSESSPVPLTASCGTASLPADAFGGSGLFRAADSALYEAKHAGRNVTITFGIEPVTTPAQPR